MFLWILNTNVRRTHWRLLVGITVAASAGCTRIHTMPLDDVTPFYRSIESKVDGKNVTIRLQNGDERRAASVQVAADSVRWLIPDIWSRQFTRPRVVHTSQVKEIVVEDRMKAGISGGILGALAGLAFSTIPPSMRPQRDVERIFLIGSLFAAVGGAGGAWAGARRGQREVFVFSEYIEGTDRYRLEKLMEGATPGVTDLIEALRSMVREIDRGEISEEITKTNIVYLRGDSQFCYLLPDAGVVKIYLSARPSDLKDAMGLVRPWSNSDSWFSMVPGGDMEYARLLITQVYGLAR